MLIILLLPVCSFSRSLFVRGYCFYTILFIQSLRNLVGVYPPLIRVYDVKDLSLKFERGLECEVAGFEVLSDDYSKMVVARTDRLIEFHVKGGKLYSTRIPKPFRDILAIIYFYPLQLNLNFFYVITYDISCTFN
jgi:hypothetical protein